MSKLTRRRLLESGLAAMAGLTGDVVFAPAIAQNSKLKIGLLGARSGAIGTIGECAIRAADWAVARINKEGGIAGRQVELIVEEETSPKDTTDRFKKLVLQDGVECVQGLISTGVMLSVAVAAEETKTIFVSWDGTTQNGVDETMPNARYTFKSTDNEVESLIASLQAIKKLKGQFKTIAGANNDYSYGRNMWAAFQALLKKYKVPASSGSEQWIKVAAVDVTSNVNAIRASNPDLVMVSLLFSESPIFMKQAHAAGLFRRAKLVYPMGGFQQSQMKKEYVPEGAIFGVNTLLFDYNQASPLQKEFVADYRERYKEIPHSAAERAYFTMEVYRRGVERAVKAAGGRWPTKEEIAANMEDLEVMSLGGKAKMKKNHIPEQNFFIGVTSHDNPYDFITLKDVEVYSSEKFQKPDGKEFWKWLDEADFGI